MAFLEMTTKGDVKFTDFMNKLEVKLPNAINRNMWNIAQMVGGELRFSMGKTSPNPIQDLNGTLRQGTYPKKGPEKNTFIFLMPRHARYLDSMEPHFVNVKNNPPLARWMAMRGYHARRDGTIYVRPRKFIRRAFERTKLRLNEELKKGEIIKTLKGEI